MLKLLFVLPPLLFLALLPQQPATPPAPAAPPAQAAPPAPAAPAAPADQTAPPAPAAPADQTAPPASAAPADQTAPAAPAAPAAEAVPQNNPVKPTAESQAHAAETYKIDCAMCHGENGNGKGDLVSDMQLSLKDLRNPDTLKDKTDGEIYTLIHNGKDKMPPEGDRAKPDELWNLVIYVRSFAKK